RTILGDDNPVRIADITDGTANTVLLTDKSVPSEEHEGFKSPLDVEWNKAGAPFARIYKFQSQNVTFSSGGWTYTQTVVSSVPDLTIPKRPANPKRGGSPYASVSESLVVDRYAGLWSQYYPNPLGNNHAAGVQPVAWADGSVRNI